MKEGYSLENLNKAKKEGNEDLNQEDKEFLEKYRKAKEEALKNGFPMSDGFSQAAWLISGMINKETKPFFSKKGGIKAEELNEKYSSTVQGQLEMAEEEATEINKEYNEKVQTLKDAADDLKNFIEKANGRKNVEVESN